MHNGDTVCQGFCVEVSHGFIDSLLPTTASDAIWASETHRLENMKSSNEAETESFWFYESCSEMFKLKLPTLSISNEAPYGWSDFSQNCYRRNFNDPYTISQIAVPFLLICAYFRRILLYQIVRSAPLWHLCNCRMVQLVMFQVSLENTLFFQMAYEISEFHQALSMVARRK